MAEYILLLVSLCLQGGRGGGREGERERESERDTQRERETKRGSCTNPTLFLSISQKGDEPDDAQVPSRDGSEKKLEQEVSHACKRNYNKSLNKEHCQ